MCGIAGLFNLKGRGAVDRQTLDAMGKALHHRGPDEQGIFVSDGVGLVSRRLSIMDVAHGQQPQADETGSIHAILNGEIYEIAKHRRALEARGHVLKTNCDTELLPHYYAERGADFLEDLNGQFSIAIHDARDGSLLVARDRYGITPFFYTTATRLGPDWFVFASEMKALFAAGLIEPTADLRGLDQVMNFIAVPGPRTCFAGIRILPQGHFLKLGGGTGSASLESPVCFSRYRFPTREEDYIDGSEDELIDRFEELLLTATERRLAADVPVGTYLSGGVDSSLITAMATRIKGKAPAIFSIAMKGQDGLDESHEAKALAHVLGTEPTVVECNADVILDNYARLVAAAEAPVVDTSAVALMKLAEAVHEAGYKTVLTGEGSDEFLGGYPWFRIANVIENADGLTFGTAGDGVRSAMRFWIGLDREARAYDIGCRKSAGGNNAFHTFFLLINANRRKFYSKDMLDTIEGVDHYAPLAPPENEIAKWHPMNRSIYWGARIFLQGHLLSLKGDRVAMANSVETRYPFLDDDVISFVSALHPKWKIRNGRSKYLLRRVAERWLPQESAWRQKKMLRGPSGNHWIGQPHPVTDRFLSREALERSGYFDPEKVMAARESVNATPDILYKRESETLGLTAVLATQIWHERFIERSGATDDAGQTEPVPVEIA